MVASLYSHALVVIGVLLHRCPDSQTDKLRQAGAPRLECQGLKFNYVRTPLVLLNGVINSPNDMSTKNEWMTQGK